jgi:hypothetical protein
MLYLTNVYGSKYSASALAANGLLRYLVGGSFPLFTIPSELFLACSKFGGQGCPDKFSMYNNLGYAWASSLLGFLPFCLGFSTSLEARSDSSACISSSSAGVWSPKVSLFASKQSLKLEMMLTSNPGRLWWLQQSLPQ